MTRSKTNKAIAYIRVSTKDQGENGNGLDLQMIRIEGFAKAAGFELVDTFRDVHTGAGKESADKREGARAAVILSQKTGWPIIVDGLSRFSRHTKTLESWILEKGLKVISAQTGENPNYAVIMGEAARAQEEVERIRRTTKEGLRRARERGVTLGNTKNLDVAQQNGAASNKAKADRQARELAPMVNEIRTSGLKTKEAIADELNRRGYRTARNERWNKDNLRRVLDRIAEIEELDVQKDRYADNPLHGAF